MDETRAAAAARNLSTPQAARARVLARRVNTSVKHALLNAFDQLGNEAFFVELGRGSAEDRRCLAMIIAKLIPIEVAGALDSTLTVKVVTQLGDREIDITREVMKSPKGPMRPAALPVAQLAHRALDEDEVEVEGSGG